MRPGGRAGVSPLSGEQVLDPGTDPRVAATVHLLHRRRGWAWTLGASLVAFVAFAAIFTSLWPNATGALETISGFIFILLFALAVVALTAVITDTVRLRRREPSVRAHAISRMSHRWQPTRSAPRYATGRATYLAWWPSPPSRC
jgi:hypothetical protein